MNSDLVISNLGGGLIHKFEKGSLELPFSTEIYLYKLSLAGIGYYIIDKEVNIEKGCSLILKREIDNKYDKYAICVYDDKYQKLGYIPRKNNKIFARLMDGGKLLIGKVYECEYYFDEIKNIIIEIYLKEL